VHVTSEFTFTFTYVLLGQNHGYTSYAFWLPVCLQISEFRKGSPSSLFFIQLNQDLFLRATAPLKKKTKDKYEELMVLSLFVQTS
jgi:hypothetical protein